MVQDLRELSLALVARMMDPRLLLAQVHTAQISHCTSPPVTPKETTTS